MEEIKMSFNKIENLELENEKIIANKELRLGHIQYVIKDTENGYLDDYGCINGKLSVNDISNAYWYDDKEEAINAINYYGFYSERLVIQKVMFIERFSYEIVDFDNMQNNHDAIGKTYVFVIKNSSGKYLTDPCLSDYLYHLYKNNNNSTFTLNYRWARWWSFKIDVIKALEYLSKSFINENFTIEKIAINENYDYYIYIE